MQIVVKTRDDPLFGRLSEDRTMQINVDSSVTIGVVKTIIQENWAIPFHQQNLLYAGLRLEDDGTLEDLSIQEGSTLILVVLQQGDNDQQLDRNVRQRVEPPPFVDKNSAPREAPAARGQRAGTSQAVEWLDPPLVSQPNIALFREFSWSARHGTFYWQCQCRAWWGCFPISEECTRQTGVLEIGYHLGGQKVTRGNNTGDHAFVCEHCHVEWW